MRLFRGGALVSFYINLDCARQFECTKPVSDDLGYLTHAVLDGLFGKGAIRPFRIAIQDLLVEGVSLRDADELLLSAKKSRFWSCVHDGRVDVDPLPMHEEGDAPRFLVDCCPVCRLGKNSAASHGLRKGTEIDVWQRHLMKGGDESKGPEQVYRQWLADRLCGSAEILDFRVRNRVINGVIRREAGPVRRPRRLTRPRVRMLGRLKVLDRDAFRRIQIRGVGRHRSFGNGLILLSESA